MNPYLLLSALRARYRLFLLIVAATVLAALVVSLLVPRTYVANVSLLLDGRDDQTVRNNNGNNGLQERERLGYLQTQVDILTSPTVARRVATDLKLAENPEFRTKFAKLDSPGSIEDWLAEAMLQRLKVETSQSSILLLSYTSSDPRMAARVANAFAKAYMDTVLELRVIPTRENSAWFNEQLKGLRDNMDQAQKRLTQFQREHNIVSTDERFDVESIQLAELASQFARTHSARIGGSVSAAANDDFNTGAASAAGLRAELARAEARLHEISVEFGPRHPRYQAQSAAVEALRARTQGASRHAAERSRESRQHLLSEIDEQRERVLKLKEARNQMAVYSHDAAVSQRIYETALQSFLTTSIDSRMLQTNVRILNAAVPPALPKSPKLRLNIALSVIVGVMLALTAVYLLEMLDQRVRNSDDLAWDPGVPTLAVLKPWNDAVARIPRLPTSRYALPAP